MSRSSADGCAAIAGVIITFFICTLAAITIRGFEKEQVKIDKMHQILVENTPEEAK